MTYWRRVHLFNGSQCRSFYRGELERIASRPSAAEWVREVREWKKTHGIDVPVSAILNARDADRD